jgi:hypothetical protein
MLYGYFCSEPGKDPITDIILLAKGDKSIPEGYTKIEKSVNAGSVSAARYLAYKRGNIVTPVQLTMCCNCTCCE